MKTLTADKLKIFCQNRNLSTHGKKSEHLSTASVFSMKRSDLPMQYNASKRLFFRTILLIIISIAKIFNLVDPHNRYYHQHYYRFKINDWKRIKRKDLPKKKDSSAPPMMSKARKQVTKKKNLQKAEGGGEYNIWYHKYLGNKRERWEDRE